jgi:hypothetical protein
MAASQLAGSVAATVRLRSGERALVFELADHAFGVGHPLPVRLNPGPSGSLRETEVAFELRRFGVGPERGSARESAGRSQVGCSPAGPRRGRAGRLARGARR